MAPKRKSASPAPSASRTPRNSGVEQHRVSGGGSQQFDMPPPDPAAVQRLIDDAIARAQANRASMGLPTPNGSFRRTTDKNWGRKAVDYMFGDRSCTFSSSTTAKLTDFAGTFLVACFAVYFTVVGYLLYREIALVQ